MLIKIVIAGPSDTENEVKIILREMENFNRQVFKSNDITFRPYYWKFINPSFNMEGIQKIIDDGLNINQADIFFCIFYKKFGQPTEDSKSATLHEIKQAVESYELKKKPIIKLYFKKQNIKDLEDEEDENIEQMRLVKQFKKEILKFAKIDGFETDMDFLELISTQLAACLFEKMNLTELLNAEGEKIKEVNEDEEKTKISNESKPIFNVVTNDIEEIKIPLINNIIRKGEQGDNLIIDFYNEKKRFIEASFDIDKINGNSWRIGILLFGNNGTYFIFHPYIDTRDAKRLNLAFTNESVDNNPKTVRKMKNIKLSPIEFKNYKIVKNEGIIHCYINNIKRYSDKDLTEEHVNDRFHIIRFQFWRHDNEEISVRVRNLRILWG